MAQKRSLDDDSVSQDGVSWPNTPASVASTAASINYGMESSYTEDQGLSPSKRTRSQPPPIKMGPLLFASDGTLSPSTIPPQPCSRPGIRRLVPWDAPLRLHLAYRHIDTNMSTFLSSKQQRLVLLFENANQRASEQFIAQLPRYQEYLVVVNDTVPTPNSLGVPAVEDPTGCLARGCRVLDPTGSGTDAAPCLVYVENDELRGTVMVGKSPEQVIRMVDLWTA